MRLVFFKKHIDMNANTCGVVVCLKTDNNKITKFPTIKTKFLSRLIKFIIFIFTGFVYFCFIVLFQRVVFQHYAKTKLTLAIKKCLYDIAELLWGIYLSRKRYALYFNCFFFLKKNWMFLFLSLHTNNKM